MLSELDRVPEALAMRVVKILVPPETASQAVALASSSPNVSVEIAENFIGGRTYMLFAQTDWKALSVLFGFPAVQRVRKVWDAV